MTSLSLRVLMLILHVGHARIWTIRVGYAFGQHFYFDANGYHQGFGVDLMDRVCVEGGMDCRAVTDAASRCWMPNKGSHASPGPGLMSRWYDACLGWYVTVPRSHAFAFSKAYLKQHSTYFWVLKGSSFNPDDLSGKKIAFKDVDAADPKCVARQTGIANNVLADWQIVSVHGEHAVIDALQNNKADAIFNQDSWTPEQSKLLDRVPREMTCTLDGGALMARKDSGIIAAWNIGFSKLTDGNGYAKFCRETVAKHAHRGSLPCLDV